MNYSKTGIIYVPINPINRIEIICVHNGIGVI